MGEDQTTSVRDPTFEIEAVGRNVGANGGVAVAGDVRASRAWRRALRAFDEGWRAIDRASKNWTHLWHDRKDGGMAEWFKAAVLKTAVVVRQP